MSLPSASAASSSTTTKSASAQQSSSSVRLSTGGSASKADTPAPAERESKRSRSRTCSVDYKDPVLRSRGSELMQVRFKTGFRNTILDVMRRRPGWKESTSDMDWDFHWADREWIYDNYHYIHLEHWQRMNHFRNDRELCRKDLLIRNVKKHRRRLEREKRVEEARLLDFCPPTYILPNDYALFVEEFKKRPGTAWIMKPVGRSQGKGIFLFRKLSEIAGWRAAYKSRLVLQNPHAASAAAKAASGEPAPEEVQTYVAQRYIAKPYLVGGKKFDMRIYALVTSFSPLTCYLYRRGFARFSATRYSNSAATQGDTAMHLTNVAIQKKSTSYNKATGGKWGLRGLKLYMAARHGRKAADKAFGECQDIVIRSLLAVADVMINDKHCFTLYGYDIMFDEKCKPWLIEVNASPSLTANTPDDYRLKYDMLSSLLDIVDIERKHVDEPTRQHVGAFDLIYGDGGPVDVGGRRSVFTTYLGADTPHPPPRTRSSSSSSSGRSSSSSGGTKRSDSSRTDSRGSTGAKSDSRGSERSRARKSRGSDGAGGRSSLGGGTASGSKPRWGGSVAKSKR